MNKKFLLASILLLLIATLACKASSPQSPTATIQPTATPIPGWIKLEGSGVEIWLPDTFEGGDLSQDLDVIVEKLRTLGSDFEQIAKTIEQNPSAFAIWAFDSNVSEAGFLTNVNITKEKVLSNMTPETYVIAMSKQLPTGLEIIEQKNVKLDHYDAIQLTVEMNLPAVQVKELVYIIKDKNTMWAITYATGQNEFEQMLPIFEQSANTFKILP